MESTQSAFVQDRLAFVQTCIAAAANVKPAVEDAALNRKATVVNSGGNPIMVHTLTV